LPRRGFLFFFLALGIFFSAPLANGAEESSADPDRLAIIRLIEDRLAEALTIRNEDETPDFGTLDRIYPQWHGGEPAKARQAWTFHSYRNHVVTYVVHTVNMDRPAMATVMGKKQVSFARKKKLLKTIPRTERKTEEARFTLVCRRRPSGDWEIMKETLYPFERD